MMPYTQAYIEMIKGKKSNRQCCKCGWFGHMAHHCRQKEILEEKKRKLMSRDNKFTPLLSKVCRRMKGGNVAYPYKGKAQPTRSWECGKVGHVLWDCSKEVAWPRRAEVQHIRKVERRKYGECGESNHRDNRCPSVRLWGEG